MEKFGHAKGQGLGSKGQGMSEPVIPTARERGTGLGFEDIVGLSSVSGSVFGESYQRAGHYGEFGFREMDRPGFSLYRLSRCRSPHLLIRGCTTRSLFLALTTALPLTLPQQIQDAPFFDRWDSPTAQAVAFGAPHKIADKDPRWR